MEGETMTPEQKEKAAKACEEVFGTALEVPPTWWINSLNDLQAELAKFNLAIQPIEKEEELREKEIVALGTSEDESGECSRHPRPNGGIHFDNCMAKYGGQCTCYK